MGFSLDGLIGNEGALLASCCLESPCLLSPVSTFIGFIFPESADKYILALEKSISGFHVLVYRLYLLVVGFNHLLLMVILHLFEQVHLSQQCLEVLPGPVLDLLLRTRQLQLVPVLFGLLHGPPGLTVVIGVQFDTVDSIPLDLL